VQLRRGGGKRREPTRHGVRRERHRFDYRKDTLPKFIDPAHVEGFVMALERIDSKSYSEDARASLRGTGLRAIEFFGGRLAPEEKQEAMSIPPHLAGTLTLEN
jgi:hypothetical protein